MNKIGTILKRIASNISSPLFLIYFSYRGYEKFQANEYAQFAVLLFACIFLIAIIVAQYRSIQQYGWDWRQKMRTENTKIQSEWLSKPQNRYMIYGLVVLMLAVINIVYYFYNK